MRIWGVVKGFSIKQLFLLAIVMLQRPLFIIPTIKATKQTILICNSLYPKEHHKNGKANAFRHALWNVLICIKTFKISKNEEKSIIWAQKVTDLHEKLAPNDPLETKMDLHNNKVGRFFFSSLKNSSEEKAIAFLREKTESAKNVIDFKSMVNHENDLVYLSED